MDRRWFLKAGLAGAAWVGLAGRSALADTVRTGAPGSDGIRAQLDAAGFRPRHPAGVGFPQSVAAGDPTPSGVMLWTRVDPGVVPAGVSADTVEPGLVSWLVDAHGTRPVGPPPASLDLDGFVLVEVSAESDPAGTSGPALVALVPIYTDLDHVVKVDLDGHLQPHTGYRYRFVTATGHVSRTGRFRTLPSTTAAPDRFRIGQVVCQDYTNGYFPALAALAAEDVDLVVHLGDYVYESVGEAGYQAGLSDRAIRLPSGSPTAQTLADYRHLYATYRTDASLQALHENHAVVAIWDDHEFANDTYAPAVAPDESLDPDPPRRAAANRAWFEYQPARVPFDPTAPVTEAITVHRSLQLGTLGELFCTDERLYRSPHPCGEDTTFERYFASGCVQQYALSQTMLGADQRDWLVDGLRGSTATWRIWANEVQLAPMTLLGRWLNLDAWDGFAGERDRLLTTLAEADVRNLLVLTGDFHTFEANLVQADWHRATPARTLGAEFMVGSVSSANLADLVQLALPSAGATAGSDETVNGPLPVSAMAALIERLADQHDLALDPGSPPDPEVATRVLRLLQHVVQLENPWIRYFDATRHGYAILELTPTAATWSAFAVASITEPTSPARPVFTGRVETARPGLRVVSSPLEVLR